MIEILFAITIGIIGGIIIGILPGLGTSTLLLLTYPFLKNFDIVPLFLFYFSFLMSSQFYGSISAIIYGVAGEISSIPAVKNGHELFQRGLGAKAVVYTSTGSFISALLGICLFFILITVFSDFFIYLLKGKVIFTLLIISLLIIILTSGNSKASIFFAILGFLIGKIGYDDLLGTRILTFGINELDAGIPSFPLFCGFIIIPLLFFYYKNSNNIKENRQITIGFFEKVKLLLSFNYFPSIFRGSFIGFISGLIPGASYTVSSNIADSSEKIIVENKKDNDSLLKRLISAESANNSATISVLIPFLVLSIPIIMSEAIILGIAQVKGFTFTNSFSFLTSNFNIVFVGLIFINLINWIIAGIFFNNLIKIYSWLNKNIYIIVGVASIFIMFYLGYSTYQFWLTITVFLISLILGMLTNKFERSKYVLIYTYFVSDLLFDEAYRYFL
jgi:putative tricarboxylic transport membrane protein